jgi:SAM-dependent methyltransferase
VIILPRKPTFSRWRKLSGVKYSVLRSLQYEALENLQLEGRILDVGGGRVNSYYHLLDIKGEIESVNISPAIQPTYIGDLNGTLPLENNQYDAVLCLNTLEHVYNDQNALCEIYRVLRDGGLAHIMVPFLYRVHGSPSDYHRHTAEAWINMLTGVGFDPDSIRVEVLAFGAGLTTAFAITEFVFPLYPRILRRIFKRIVLLLPLIQRGSVRRIDYPIGYYIQARKK